MSYGFIASMRCLDGRRDDVVSLLLSGLDDLRGAGCEAYVVSRSDTDEDTIWVFEVWRSEEHHVASLQLPQVRASINEAMPMLTGEFTGQAVTVVGGLGVDRATGP